jgi:hypothetical protein
MIYSTFAAIAEDVTGSVGNRRAVSFQGTSPSSTSKRLRFSNKLGVIPDMSHVSLVDTFGLEIALANA